MPRFREVEFWPSTGHKGKRWTDEPATDAWVKSARRVSELYSEALDSVGLTGPVGFMRLMTFPLIGEDDAVRAEVHLDGSAGWESGVVRVPPSVAHLSAGTRARMVFDVLHGAVCELAPHRGWEPEDLAAVRDYALARDLRFQWATPWKANRQRSLQARAFFRLEDDGYGRAVIEVRDRTTEELVARSDDALAFSTLAGFKRAARTLTWIDRGTVELVPYSDLLGRADGVLRLDPARGVQPLRGLDADELVTEEHRVPVVVSGKWEVPDGPSIRVIGGGPTNGVPDAYLEELDRCLDAVERDYLEWWAGADRQQLELWYDFGDGPEGPVTRRVGKRLVARIRRAPATIRRAVDPGEQARADVRELMDVVGDKMKLGPQPGFRPE